MDNYNSALNFQQNVNIIKISVVTFECIIALVANALFITVFSLRPQLRNQGNYLNIGLAISGLALTIGFLVKTLVTMLIPVLTMKYVTELSRCPLYQGILWHCLVLVGCAVDRWISITKPLHYETIVKTRKLTIYIVISGIISGLFSFSLFLSPIDPQNYADSQNHTHPGNETGDETVGELINLGYYVISWIWVLALAAMNIITMSIYSVILCILRRQMQKIQPNKKTLQRPRNMYRGVIKLLFIMLYFTVCWGLFGLVLFLHASGVITLELRQSKAFVIFDEILEIMLMTTSFINIICYGLINKQFKCELKSIISK